MYLGMAISYAGPVIGFDGPITFGLLLLALLAIQQVVPLTVYLAVL
jgi:tetrahydromethanopterin S-methyltransferase subunit E